MRLLISLLLIPFVVAACKDNASPDPGDPLPNAKAGMEALYKGDFNAMNTYFCKEIILSLRGSVAEEQAEAGGHIDLSQTTFEDLGEVKDNLIYVRISGEYAIWRGESAVVRNTQTTGAILLLMEAREGVWQICNIESETPQTEGN